MSALTPAFVERELYDFYMKFKDNPVYQADTLRVWDTEGKAGKSVYSGAYAAVVKKILKEKAN